jgi:hypothetical protein
MPIGMLLGVVHATRMASNAANLKQFIRTGEEVVALTAVAAAGTAVIASSVRSLQRK